MQFILVGLGGFLGAIARFSVNRAFSARAAADGSLAATVQPAFPLSTLLVNVAGSFFIGLLVVLAGSRLWLEGDTRLFLVTGFLGAFTTFSAFSLETLQLFESGEQVKALFNVLVNVFLCLLFVWLGAQLGRFMNGGFA